MSAPWKFLPCPNCCGCVCYQDQFVSPPATVLDNYTVRSGSGRQGTPTALQR